MVDTRYKPRADRHAHARRSPPNTTREASIKSKLFGAGRAVSKICASYITRNNTQTHVTASQLPGGVTADYRQPSKQVM